MPAPDKEEQKRQKAELEARYRQKQELLSKHSRQQPKSADVYMPPPETLSRDLAMEVGDSQDRLTGFNHMAHRIKQNPLIPCGMALTVFALCNGLRNMVKQRQAGQQRMMRLRVFGQGFTIMALVMGTVLLTVNPNDA